MQSIEFSRIEFNRSVRLETDGRGGTLLDVDGGVYYGFNAVGAAIAAGIERRAAPSAIIESLADRFPGASREHLEADFESFVGQLTERGIVSEGDGVVSFADGTQHG